MPKILHVLSQRPALTGSGITLDAVVRQADQALWQQAAVVGIPAADETPSVGLLPRQNIHPVRFGKTGPGSPFANLDFPVPGMSDVMPYPSTVWSTLSSKELVAYRQVWKAHLEQVIYKFQPDVIHSHHIWLVSSLLKDIAPSLPVVTTCHATGLRQLKLCPHLADEVIAGCRRNDHFLVLHQDHALQLEKTLGIEKQRITVTGVGYREEIFHRPTPEEKITPQDLLYVGKFSHAKGLPWLLDAFKDLQRQFPHLKLHIAGGGSGPEAESLRTRMQEMAPAVVMHGLLDQKSLAQLMQRCRVCILPSFYEGVPLVLVEAAACGCRLVSTQLPGVVEQIAPVLEEALDLVPLPRLHQVDQPHADDLPLFKTQLVAAMQNSLQAPPPAELNLNSFTWNAVFKKVESIWESVSL